MTIKISEYCLTAYDLFKSSVYRWHSRLNKDAERAISRVFYQAVRDTNPDKTGFSTLPRISLITNFLRCARTFSFVHWTTVRF